MKRLAIIFLGCFAVMSNALAQEPQGGESGLAMPRMVSLKFDKVHARSGPGQRYPIEWIYLQEKAPVEVVSEYGDWRQIKDWQGSEVWVNKTQLSSARSVKVTSLGENNIYAKPDYKSKIIAKVEQEVIGEPKECPLNKDFCLIKFGNIKGWIPRSSLYGLYPKEVIQ